MKLLIITPYFYPKIGGLENYVYNIAEELKNKYKWNIVIITSNHDTVGYKEENVDNIKVYRLPILFKISNTPINPFWYFYIKNIIKKEKPNIINAHSPVPFIADIAVWIKGNIPFVLTYHSGSMIKGKKITDLLIHSYEKLFLPILFDKCNKIIITSLLPLSNLSKYSNKITSIPPGVDTNIFKPSKINNKSLDNILYVGRIEKTSEWKGIYYLLDAMSIVINKYPKLVLNLVGSGDAISDYKAYAKKIKISANVMFLGFQKGSKLVNIYNNSTIVVLPSTTESESFGTVLIEGMAMGKPVVASEVGGIPYLVEDKKTGILVPPKNIGKLASAIIYLIENKKTRKFYGENGRNVAIEGYSLNSQIKKTYTTLKIK